MRKWNLIVDVSRCENCNNCFLADKDEYCGNRFPGYTEEQPRHGHRWIDIKKRERGSGSLIDVAYLPTMCNQCQDAPCVNAAKDGEIYRRDDGIVIIDPMKAKGHKRLVKSCPYGHIWWNEELQLPQKWFFDAHLLDQGWKVPRCVQSCPTGALSCVYIEDDAMQMRVAEDSLEVLHPEYETQPRVWYKNLYRFNKDHISGTLVMDVGDHVDCAEDSKVTLYHNGQPVAQCQSDCFGDFKFDQLEPDSGHYTVVAEYGQLRAELMVELNDSINIGVVKLTA
ncbi:4Fe-4S dicluster domain-containing protein [Photobacterium sp. DNB23_23_1]